MNNDPLVSIIIPTFNRAKFLGETLDSVLAQTYQNWECLVIDDGSNDTTAELLGFYTERYPQILYEKRPVIKPKGANACRNHGFELSKGKYIQWFDSDDIMHPEKLSVQVDALEKSNDHFSVCQTLVFNENIEGARELRHPRIISANFFEDYIMFRILWLTQAPLWKKEFLEKQNMLFDEDLQAAQEWEFHVRILSLVKGYHVTNRPLVYLRYHKNNISNEEREKVLWNYFLARLKIFRRFETTLSSRVHLFLVRYFLNSYKNALRYNHMKLAKRIWIAYISTTKNLSSLSKAKLTLAYFSFKLFKKGNIFIGYLNK